MCNYLGKTTIMTHYEYCVKYKFFMDFYGQNGFGSIGMIPMYFEGGIYNVYSKSTAKYYKGNMREIIKKQFEEECYE